MHFSMLSYVFFSTLPQNRMLSCMPAIIELYFKVCKLYKIKAIGY